MLVVVVVHSSSDIASILEVLPGWQSLVVDFFQNIILLSAFLGKSFDSVLPPVSVLFDGIDSELLQFLVNVILDLRNVSGCESETRGFDVLKGACLSEPANEPQCVL